MFELKTPKVNQKP